MGFLIIGGERAGTGVREQAWRAYVGQDGILRRVVNPPVRVQTRVIGRLSAHEAGPQVQIFPAKAE
jgi:hypothetical protein